MKAFWNYYLTINAVNLPITLAFGLAYKLSFIPVIFCTFGLGMGLFTYRAFFKSQYYFYHNLGFTKMRLAVKVVTVNAVLAILLWIIILLF